MKKTFSVGLLSVILLTTLATPVSAATILPRLQQREENIKDRVQQRCDTATTKIDLMIAQYDLNRQRHLQTYTQVVGRLKTLDSRLKSKGYDTTQIEKDYNTLNDKVIVFGKDVQAVADQLKIARQQECGNSNGAFKAELLKAQQLTAKARADAQDMRQYYQTVIRKDVLLLKQQSPK